MVEVCEGWHGMVDGAPATSMAWHGMAWHGMAEVCEGAAVAVSGLRPHR